MPKNDGILIAIGKKLGIIPEGSLPQGYITRNFGNVDNIPTRPIRSKTPGFLTGFKNNVAKIFNNWKR